DDGPAHEPHSSLESREDCALVRRALDELSPEFRDPLILKELEGMKYEEIALVLDIPVGTVRSRIHRARQELKEKLTRATA
ncbi:MAG: sigma-70 family RNA polymerase sigma factor, partial [Planctomycetaceae bacterium]|nr:sigma-70 family RNA polymerase sigma factor [Planctomycetaceae bacterium]